jgi:hypothetical protein
VRTPCFSPLCKSKPFLLSGHIQKVSNERVPSGSWRQLSGRLSTDKPNQDEQDEEDERYLDIRDVGRRHERRELGWGEEHGNFGRIDLEANRFK